jgi:hypothetical protein
MIRFTRSSRSYAVVAGVALLIVFLFHATTEVQTQVVTPPPVQLLRPRILKEKKITPVTDKAVVFFFFFFFFLLERSRS